MDYSSDDIQIVDAHETIRRNPQMYVGLEKPTTDILIGRFVTDIVTRTNSLVYLSQSEDWWLIGSRQEWLVESTNTKSVRDYFLTFIPTPEAGVNAFRAEVLVAAFATDVVVFDKLQRHIVKGSSGQANCPDVPRECAQSVAIRFCQASLSSSG